MKKLTNKSIIGILCLCVVSTIFLMGCYFINLRGVNEFVYASFSNTGIVDEYEASVVFDDEIKYFTSIITAVNYTKNLITESNDWITITVLKSLRIDSALVFNETNANNILLRATEPQSQTKITRGNGLKQSVMLDNKKGVLCIQNLTLDGGAVWQNLNSTNLIDCNTTNNGIVSKAPIIINREFGILKIESGTKIKNNDNSTIESTGNLSIEGGGIISYGNLIIDGQSKIEYNRANRGGGLLLVSNNNTTSKSATIKNAEISYNFANINGGGIYANKNTNINTKFNLILGTNFGSCIINNNTSSKGSGGISYFDEIKLTQNVMIWNNKNEKITSNLEYNGNLDIDTELFRTSKIGISVKSNMLFYEFCILDSHLSTSLFENEVFVSDQEFQFELVGSRLLLNYYKRFDYEIENENCDIISQDNYVQHQKDYCIKFKALLGYKLPEQITIEVDHVIIDTNKYSYNKTNGEIIMRGEAIINNIKIRIKAIPQKFNIEYFDKGGADFSGEGNLIEIHTYNETTQLTNPTKVGYLFVGWYFDNDCLSESIRSIQSETVCQNISLYAKWESKTTKLRLIQDDICLYELNIKYNQNNIIYEYQTNKRGYDFLEYCLAVFDDENKLISSIAGYSSNMGEWKNETSQINIMPRFQPRSDTKYHIDIFLETLNNEFEDIPSYTFEREGETDSVIQLDIRDFETEGYSFCLTENNITNAMISAETTTRYKLYFSRIEYRVIFMIKEHEVYAIEIYKYLEDIETNITNPAKNGYRFIKWKNLPEKMPSNDVIVFADWEIITANESFISDAKDVNLLTTAYLKETNYVSKSQLSLLTKNILSSGSYKLCGIYQANRENDVNIIKIERLSALKNVKLYTQHNDKIVELEYYYNGNDEICVCARDEISHIYVISERNTTQLFILSIISLLMIIGLINILFIVVFLVFKKYLKNIEKMKSLC